jgi:ABC-type uncharacterized transport system involved in gliding motility auxiliary subunit
LLRSARSWLEAALFLLAILFCAASLLTSNETAANSLLFAAWFAALLLVFSLGLRLPAHLRGPAARALGPAVVLAAVIVVIVGNVALYRHDVHLDVTVTRRYTAPPELETVARGIDREVLVNYFYNAQDPNALVARDVLGGVARQHPNLHLRPLDLDRELVAAREYGVRLYNTVVVEAAGRRAQVDNTVDLRQVAYAIERVLKQRVPLICFVTGHGEPYEAIASHVHFGHVETLGAHAEPGAGDVLEAPNDGLDRLKLALESIGYVDRPLELATVSAVPQDCNVLADLGPRTAYDAAEVHVVEEYMARGGRVLLMYDPEFPVTAQLASLLGEVGLAVADGVVVDPTNHSGTEEDRVAVPYYPPHPITDQVSMTVFPGPRAIRLRGNVTGVQVTELIASSQDSYLRPAAATAPGSVKTAERAVQRGPATLAVALQGVWPEDGTAPFRLVLVGNAAFAVNAFFPYASNGELVVSMVRWLAEDGNTPKLTPANYSLPEIRLTHRQMQVTFLLVEVLLPLSVMLLGAYVWWRRR